MLIRKSFRFEHAHVVRNCSTRRCAFSLHGHSYVVEILLTASALDRGGMVLDFGIMKGVVHPLIDAWDHAVSFWDQDEPAYIRALKNHSERWIGLPVNPSAEQMSRVFFVLIDRALTMTPFTNGETGVTLDSVIVHETATASAQCWRRDAYDPAMGGEIEPNRISFSEAIRADRKVYGQPRLTRRAAMT